ncbi:hypothetical protein U1Q18_018542 [Sarracenia purpurea var. burkii]
MRVADVLMITEDEFAGGDSCTAQLRSGRRRRKGSESCKSFGCRWPRSPLFRWLSAAKKSERQKNSEAKSEKEERKSRREGSDGEGRTEREEEVGPSVNGLDGKSSSPVLELKEESETDEVSGQCKKDYLNLAVGFGLFYLIAASKNELNKMIELRTEMEMLLQNVTMGLQNRSREIMSKLSESNEIPACSTSDAQENLCSNGHVSLQHGLFFKELSDSKATELCDKSMCCKATRQENSMEGIDLLEAELEVELERLQLHLDTGDFYEYPKQQRVESSHDMLCQMTAVLRDTIRVTVEDTSPTGSWTTSIGEVVDPSEAGNKEHFGVDPNELEKRLHELLELRQEERIKELEAALEFANQKLCEKEIEVCWWKDTAELISQHVPETSPLSL